MCQTKLLRRSNRQTRCSCDVTHLLVSHINTMSINPPPQTPVNKRNMTPREIMEDFELPTEMADPIQSVSFGWYDTTRSVLHQEPGQPEKYEMRFLRESVALARQILLHPQAESILMEMYHKRGQGSPELTLRVVQYILYTRHWNIVLERDMDEGCFGLHYRPKRMVDEDVTRIHLNYRVRESRVNEQHHQRRLTCSEYSNFHEDTGDTAQYRGGTRRACEAGFEAGAGHSTLSDLDCHGCRDSPRAVACPSIDREYSLSGSPDPQLRDYLKPYGVKLPRKTPCKLRTPFHTKLVDGRQEGESGWFLEDRLMGGEVRGCTAKKRPRRGRQAAQDQQSSVSLAAAAWPDGLLRIAQVQPIQFLALVVHDSFVDRFGAEQVAFYSLRIQDEWVRETIEGE